MSPWFLVLAVLTCLVLNTSTRAIEPWSENPWYWSVDGKPVLLLGASDDDNLFQWPAEELTPQLDRIAAAGGNVIRNTMSDRPDRGTEVYPFAKVPSGKYDLNQWNDVYWDRFERLLAETKKRGIFIQIEVWDRFDYVDDKRRGPRRWLDHPYNPANNVNYGFEESGLDKTYPDHPGQNKQPFFFTTPKQRNNQVLLPFQQRFVAKLLHHSLRYDHVLYCIDNETKAEPEWGEYWAGVIHDVAGAAGTTVQVTEMWDDWKLTAERHKQTFDRPDIYSYVDVSQNNHNKGDEHWDNFLFVREYLAKQPRPMNTTKTYGADGNKFKHNDQDAIERFWRHLLAGAASIRFHRPPSGLGINDKAVACLKAARDLERMVKLWNIEPANDLLGDRDANEAFLAASADRRVFAAYFPAADGDREVTLQTDMPVDDLQVQWISIDNDARQTSQLTGDAPLQLSPPGPGNWAVVIRN